MQTNVNDDMPAYINTSITASHFLPFDKDEIFDLSVSELGSDDREHASVLYRLLKNQIHFEFHSHLERLEKRYRPLNPFDLAATRTTEQMEANAKEFAEDLRRILRQANYTELSQRDLDKAFKQSSLFRIRLHVDFSDYRDVVLFSCGETEKTEHYFRLFGRFFRREITFINYDRVVLFLHFKDQVIDASLQGACAPGSVVLKLFQNVPKADLEMLFPNTEIRMRLKDKLMIGIPALVSGIIVAATKLGASFIILAAIIGYWLGFSNERVTLDRTSLLVLLAGFATLGGYIWKQFSGFKSRKLKFIQTLTQSLYFKNLDNNEGVFHRLINEAEDQECKEALLAYFHLLRAESPMSAQLLDYQLEQWLLLKTGRQVDFDIQDALNKLLNFGLVEQTAQSYQAVPLAKALAIMDARWDAIFSISGKK